MILSSKASMLLHQRMVAFLRSHDATNSSSLQQNSRIMGVTGLTFYLIVALLPLYALIGLQMMAVGSVSVPGGVVAALSMMVLLFSLFVLVDATIGKLTAEIDELSEHVLSANNALAAAETKLTTIATQDEQTGCANAGHFQREISRHVSMCNRFEYEFSLVTIHIDQTAQVIADFGMQSGNEIMQLFGRLLCGTLRDVDVVGRVSPERFGLILSGTPESEAMVIIDRINGLVAQFYMPEDRDLKFTTSSGVTSFHGREEPAQLLRNATRALELATTDGPNRVAFYNHPGSDPGAQLVAAQA